MLNIGSIFLNMFKKLILLYIILLSFPGIAQIYSPDIHYGEPVKYTPFKDSVFVFNQPGYGDKINITLAAVSPDSADGWAFTWFKYDTVSLNYTFVLSETGSSSKIDNISTYAGYRLIRSKGGNIDTSQVWVLFHDYKAAITDKDENGNIPVGQTGCFTTSLTTAFPVGNYKYHIPGINAIIKDTIIYLIIWKNNPVEGGLPPVRFGYVTMSNPPYENTTYTQIVRSSKFGLERRDSVNYIAVKSKSGIGHKHIPLYDKNYYPEQYGENYPKAYDDNLTEKSVPARFKFYSAESKNAVRFELNFGDKSDSAFYSTSDTIIHEYRYPGNYTAKLFTYAQKPQECKDSSMVEIVLSNPILGEADSIKFPNVFTPNGDGENDVFRTRDVSVYFITITIFNRYGKKVHEFSGNIRDWPGWDGHILNSKREATEGIYYYVVDFIVAYESVNNIIGIKEYDKKQKTGFVYLFRGDKDNNPD